MRKNKKLVDARFAKTAHYKKVIQEAESENACPLCTLKWHTNPILKTIGNWFITETIQPYKNADRHFLIIGKQHREQLSELAPRDWMEISQLQKWAVKKYHLTGGGLAMRFGDTTYTGATISHLHMHLIVPKLKRGRAIPVWFPFG